ncbi:GH25 family lysozyme [Parafannyhessea umbonata]|uniref:GH25 family lysozyme n=1 Tax=Parafannyhessea umbonata TaxID=604330 RepID=UPI00359CAE39
MGWLGWMRNGSDAGTNLSADSVEAVEALVKVKGSDAPGSTVKPFAYEGQLNGFDISSFQAGINVSKVSGDFVFIKATQRIWYKDQLPSKGYDYAAWSDEALASGKLVGFYHYAEGGDPIKEADCFYDAIRAYKERAVVALDWGQTSNKLFGTGFDVQWCKRFLDRIASLMDARPLVYMSKSVTRKYDWSSVAVDYPLWAAQYANSKATGYNYNSNPCTDSYGCGVWASPTVFQCFANGRLDGYGADLDLDLFYGSRTTWLSLE